MLVFLACWWRDMIYVFCVSGDLILRSVAVFGGGGV